LLKYDENQGALRLPPRGLLQKYRGVIKRFQQLVFLYHTAQWFFKIFLIYADILYDDWGVDLCSIVTLSNQGDR
jgi:hypothetical protein